MVHKKYTFWQLFRLIFVVFFLYLTGDAFYRWDGFRYYASFSEFMPGFALITILWSIVAVLTTCFVWVSFRIFLLTSRFVRLKIGFEHLLVYLMSFILVGALAWKGKKIIWPYAQTSIQLKLIIFVFVAFLAVLLTWPFRGRAEKINIIIQERITPLVWLFGFIVISSVPLVAYYTWSKPDRKELFKDTNSLVTNEVRPNIILVTFDALAARNMSVYGYNRETTPFISTWAGNATLFTKVEASSNFTTPAAVSLITGKRVWTHQTYHIEGTKPVSGGTESLPTLLKANGYFNVALVVNPHASVAIIGISDSIDIAPSAVEFSTPLTLLGARFGVIEVFLYRLFADKIKLHDWIIGNDFILYKLLYSFSEDFSQTQVPTEKVLNRFLKIIDSNIPKPYFAWIHILPPHDPYLPPDKYKGFFGPSLKLMGFKAQDELKVESYKYLFQYQQYPKSLHQSIARLRDYYDEFIRYCDEQFKNFYEQLSKRNELDNTILILSSDHGESFEHGYFTHGGPFLYEQVTHIPLIIKEPGQTTGRIIRDLVEQIDIPATILDMVNIPVPLWMEGRSLEPLMQGEKLQPRAAFSMNFEENQSRGHQITRGSIAVWEGDYKLIYYLKRKQSLLFNLKNDPDELNNLILSEPGIARHMLRLINDHLEKANEKMKN